MSACTPHTVHPLTVQLAHSRLGELQVLVPSAPQMLACRLGWVNSWHETKRSAQSGTQMCVDEARVVAACDWAQSLEPLPTCASRH